MGSLMRGRAELVVIDEKKLLGPASRSTFRLTPLIINQPCQVSNCTPCRRVGELGMSFQQRLVAEAEEPGVPLGVP
jgi:hypothetical protein